MTKTAMQAPARPVAATEKCDRVHGSLFIWAAFFVYLNECIVVQT